MAVATAVMVAPVAALADSYAPCNTMESTVKAGQTSKAQSITCVQKPTCGESWGQIYDVTWDMVVHTGGVTVKSMKIHVTHTRGEDITLGVKNIRGTNADINIGGKDLIPANQTSWTKTYDITDRYFAKNSLGFVDFWLAISSDKANGCSGSSTWLRYGLKIA